MSPQAINGSATQALITSNWKVWRNIMFFFKTIYASKGHMMHVDESEMLQSTVGSEDWDRINERYH